MTNEQPTFLERTEAQRQYLYNVLTVAVPVAIAYGIIDGVQAALWLALGGAILGIGTAAAVLKRQRKSSDTGGMTLPSVEVLNGIGVVGLVILFAIALAREWLVTGPSHRREIASRDRTIAMLEARGDKDAESIGTFANTQRDMNAEKASETRLIAAVRDALLSNQGQQT